MLSYFYWNPKKEIFTIPYLNIPIVWYSLFFLIGFIISYYIFISILRRYFYLFENFTDKDILSFDILRGELKNPKTEEQKKVSEFFFEKTKNENILDANDKILELLNLYIDGKIKNRLFLEYAFSKAILSTKSKLIKITDTGIVYIVIATIIGARLGHLIFYESPSYYLKNPINIIKVWQGGLASHGAAIAILIALFIFCYYLKKFTPRLRYVHLLDFVGIPIALTCFFIRMGNFFNQEILGVQSSLPWAVIFGSPMENVTIVPRHPVQLYEGLFYLILFGLLLILSYRKYFLIKEGKIFGIFFILANGFRFFIEFLKVRQSAILETDSFLLMGQYLSIPFIALGIFFLFWDKIKSFFLKNI
ncbi:MAG: Prolipoprotein diacylglyceryl transferase [Candidatus Anoxychlamydiales bacterium]|nr:Prolipoprotein diacylglyceryl transferase [Candidatus Anoxychlamydiales bacterium]